jgi:quercetin dioxygenase-like cupin family protein
MITLLEHGIDITGLQDKLNTLSNSDWEGNIMEEGIIREVKFRTEHKDTNSILIQLNGITGKDGKVVPDHELSTYKYPETYEEWYPYVKSIVDVLVPKFGTFVSRLLLVKLKAGGVIPPHKDSGRSLTKCRRIHIPIITNPKVMFTVGDITINMLEGSAYEINNQLKHSVTNKGEDRVHMIIDIY